MWEVIFNYMEDSLCNPEEDVYPVEDDFLNYFHEEEVVKNTWLCDSAANRHIKNSIEGMSHDKEIIVGDTK